MSATFAQKSRAGSARMMRGLLAAIAALSAASVALETAGAPPAARKAGQKPEQRAEQNAAQYEKEKDASPREKPQWNAEPVEALSATRGQICLNGVWQFVPMGGKDEAKPAGGVAWIRVPGSWQSHAPLPGLVSAHGQGPSWKDFGNGSEARGAWYLRKIRIPAEWAGRAILVALTRVSTDATVYANGTKCGSVDWPRGEVDISGAVKAGEEATLWIQVVATTEGTDTAFLDPGRVVKRKSTIKARGLIGDVFLSSRPRAAHVSDVFVQTSTRNKELKLEVELTNVAAAGPAQFVARLIDGDGREERRFEAAADLKAAETQTAQLSWKWENPRLWDFLQPNLYTLKLEAKGAQLDDEYAQPFGFREFWIEGKKFFLNGSEIRLRPTTAGYGEGQFSGSQQLIDAHLDGIIHAGFNIEECWPKDEDTRGILNYRELLAERADRKGFLLLGESLLLTRYRNQWNKPGRKQLWETRMARQMRVYRNHPSIVIWTTNPNFLGHGLDQEPRHLGRHKDIPDDDWKSKARIANAAEEIVKKHDPTRPLLNHAGSSVGDIYNINCYLNWHPLQEREEWLSAWAKSGDMPLMVVEFGTPWECSFLRNRWGLEGAKSEPLVTEYCAIYLGEEAYALENPAYRQAIHDNFAEGDSYKNSWSQQPLLDFAPAVQKVLALFNRNTYRSWRTMGISGGMIPWDQNGFGWDCWGNERRRKAAPDDTERLRPFQPGMRGLAVASASKRLTHFLQPGGPDIYPSGVALTEANGPTLAWITGGADAWTAKDHSFLAGQEVVKQVALLNDERTPQDYAYLWRVDMDGRQIATDGGKGRIDPAQTLFAPLRFQLPQLSGGATANASIMLTAQIGARKHQDTFTFRAFAKPAPPQETLTVWDPVGKSAKMLAFLGCAVKEWTGAGAPGLLVVGRESLSRGNAPPLDIEAVVREGGRVLLCGQDPQWLHDQFGFRVAPQLSRRVYPVSARHPVLQGLEANDLRDWAGESTLVEAYPEAALQSPAWRSPPQGWHWGNRGGVTSAALEKPHRSGWRPILQCEFDLAYSPLLELDYGKGRLVLCALDLEDHVSLDPAAAALARNIIHYAAGTAPIARAGRTILVGDAQDKRLLDGLGVVYDAAGKIDPDADLVIVGRGVTYDAADVRSCMSRGRKVLFLARSAPDATLGLEWEQAPDTFAGSLHVPAWPECEGLSASDLHWRTPHPAWLIKSGAAAGAEVGADGLLGCLREGPGVAIYCQLDPDRFDADKQTYFRFTRWRQTRALAQILANLGAVFRADGAIGLAPKREPDAALYHPDYRDDFPLGDDPYRYFRW